MPEPHIDHQTIALAFGNALSFLLEEGEGIIAQGETADKKMHRFLVWRHNEKIRVALGDHIDKLPGSRFRTWGTSEDTIFNAALEGGEFIIDE